MIKSFAFWTIILTLITILVLIAALFLTPSFTYRCSGSLLMCLDSSYDLVWYERWAKTLQCTYYNVICVLKGAFL